MALRKEGPPLEVYLPGAIKYIDHARKLRAQCVKLSVKCTRQTWDHSAQAASRHLEGFLTDRFPANSCPLASRFPLLSRRRQITPVRRGKIWWGNSLLLYAFLLSLDSINRDLHCLKFIWTVEDWRCYLLSSKAFVPKSWNHGFINSK